MKKSHHFLKNEILFLRKQIDLIDESILGLINTRLHLVESIGHLKHEERWCVVDNVREAHILSRLKTLNKGLLEPSFLCDIFSGIIAASRTIQVKNKNSCITYESTVISKSFIKLSKKNSPIFTNPEPIHESNSALVCVYTTTKVDCSYFFDFFVNLRAEIYMCYYKQTKYSLTLSMSSSEGVYIYTNLHNQYHNWAQRSFLIM